MTRDALSENQQLRRQLSGLIAHARENERISHRFQALELELISAGSFKELIESVLQGYRKTADLDAVTLAMVDPEYEIQRTLRDLGIELADFPDLLFFADASEFTHLIGPLLAPALGRFSIRQHAALFPQPPKPASSVAILPLVRQKGLIGSLNVASRAEDRFVPGMATDFIQRLAAIVAISLENVINNERLKHIGLTDPLTGAHNRRYLEQRLCEEVSRAQRQGHPLACLFLDIDHFKQVNDSHGHQVGDRVLREVAERIKAQLRLSDTLGRYGGEEFVVLLVNANRSTAAVIAERIRQSIAERVFMIDSQDGLAVTLSIGIASLLEYNPAESVEAVTQTLIAHADQALYRAKEYGRNRVM